MEKNTSNSDTKTALFLLLGCSFSLISFVGGLIIGLVIFGWLLWPVQWVDAAPADLHHGYQLIYIEMVVDAFEDTHDLNQARYRLDPWDAAEALQLLDEAFGAAIADGLIERADAIRLLIESYETTIP